MFMYVRLSASERWLGTPRPAAQDDVTFFIRGKRTAL